MNILKGVKEGSRAEKARKILNGFFSTGKYPFNLALVTANDIRAVTGVTSDTHIGQFMRDCGFEQKDGRLFGKTTAIYVLRPDLVDIRKRQELGKLYIEQFTYDAMSEV